MVEMQSVTGGCHCGAVRYRFDTLPAVNLLDCNCSICSMTGFLHLIIKHGDFQLIQGREILSAYRFGSGRAEHLFCQTCGIKSFYQPRSHPEAWSVNFRCLDQGHTLTAAITPFDGRNWEAAREQLD